ncbi:TetR/AcrR family transcriptional regulator [bacterium]|nr:TetR/AcrR family transcriptional regulator [bacterium]
MTGRTRGGFEPSGVSADRRAAIDATPGPKAARTRARLLDAARVVFAQHGYVDTTVEFVVAEAGLARGSFYTYFESKTELFRHLASVIDAEIDREVVKFDRPRGDDPIQNLDRSNRNYLAVVRRNADLYQLVEQVAAHDSDVGKARLRSRQRHVARVALSIRRWQANGFADADVDPTITAAALVAMISGFAQWQYVAGDTYDENEAATVLTSIWVKACGLRVDSQ